MFMRVHGVATLGGTICAVFLVGHGANGASKTLIPAEKLELMGYLIHIFTAITMD